MGTRLTKRNSWIKTRNRESVCVESRAQCRDYGLRKRGESESERAVLWDERH